MKRINLLPPPPAVKLPASLPLAGAALVFALVFTHLAYLQISLNARRRELAGLERENATLAHTLAPLRASVAEEEKRKERFNTVRAIASRKTGWSDTFRGFSEALPSGVWLTGLTSVRESGNLRFLLKGEAGSTRKVASFLTKLEELPVAAGARLNFSELQPTVEPPVYRFEMTVPVGGGGHP